MLGRKLIKFLEGVGYSWIIIVGVYVFLQYIRVLVTEGLPFGQRLFSFLNLWNIFFVLISLMPGLLCIFAAHFFKKNLK